MATALWAADGAAASLEAALGRATPWARGANGFTCRTTGVATRALLSLDPLHTHFNKPRCRRLEHRSGVSLCGERRTGRPRTLRRPPLPRVSPSRRRRGKSRLVLAELGQAPEVRFNARIGATQTKHHPSPSPCASELDLAPRPPPTSGCPLRQVGALQRKALCRTLTCVGPGVQLAQGPLSCACAGCGSVFKQFPPRLGQRPMCLDPRPTEVFAPSRLLLCAGNVQTSVPKANARPSASSWPVRVWRALQSVKPHAQHLRVFSCVLYAGGASCESQGQQASGALRMACTLHVCVAACAEPFATPELSRSRQGSMGRKLAPDLNLQLRCGQLHRWLRCSPISGSREDSSGKFWGGTSGPLSTQILDHQQHYPNTGLPCHTTSHHTYHLTISTARMWAAKRC